MTLFERTKEVCEESTDLEEDGGDEMSPLTGMSEEEKTEGEENEVGISVIGSPGSVAQPTPGDKSFIKVSANLMYCGDRCVLTILQNFFSKSLAERL